MKYLSDYTNEKQTALFRKTGTFFAFNNEQLKEGRKEGVEYVNMGMGMLTPKENVPEIINGLYDIQQEGIAQDIKENGKEAIILRELANHEAWYTGDIQSTVDALEGYGFTEGQILIMFKNRKAKIW